MGQKILWQGEIYLNEAQVITLSEKISQQKTGIAIVFSRYDSGAQDNTFQTCFIPKQMVALKAGKSWSAPIVNDTASIVTNKFFYVYDDRITGSTKNNEGNTKLFVFRYVIGL